MSDATQAFLRDLDARVADILDHCSRCGRCVEVCPTAEPAGVDRRDPRGVVDDVLAILRGGADADSRGARWARTCTGSGACIEACDDGVNPRFMLAMARTRLARGGAAAETAGRDAFRTMVKSVRVLSRLQLSPATIERCTTSQADAPAALALYLGCNVIRTPHIALLCMDVLDRLGTPYRVFGGPGSCCGVIQFRAGDAAAGGALGRRTVNAFAMAGSSKVLTWCPTCTIQLGEIAMPGAGADFGLGHVVLHVAERLDALRPHFVRRVERRVALHEHPGVPGVAAGVTAILRAIPGLEVVELDVPRVGYMCNSLAPVPAYKRALHRQELDAAAAAGVDALVGIYHACHRELCAHEATSPFEVVNFLELVGEAMGIARPDLLKQWKLMRDVDRVIDEVAPRVAEAGLGLEEVREVLLATIMGEQPLAPGARA